MKIGMIGAVPFNLIFGGGETQLINTMEYLKHMDVDVDYYNLWDKDYKCDILHIFGCHYWLYQWAYLAKQKGIKIALSTITYSEETMNLKRRAYDMADKIWPVETTYGLTRKLIQISDILLPNSFEEVKHMETILGAKGKLTRVIPNATDIRYKYAKKDSFVNEYGLEDFVLCVGKIEPRKNQLKLVQALEGTNIPVVLLGSYIPNKKDYYDEVLSIVNRNENMHHIEYFPYDSDLLSSVYAAAKVHVLLGQTETPGIVNLEAGLAGANLVVGDCIPVREYLKDYALYCDYTSLDDIREKVIKAYETDKSIQISKFIEDNYTWDKVAKKTYESYELICK